MQKITTNQRKRAIIELFFQEKVGFAVSSIFDNLKKQNVDISLISIKRDLSEFIDKGYLEKKGAGPSTLYTLTTKGKFFFDINPQVYCDNSPSNRFGQPGYTFDIFNNINFDIFTEEESRLLTAHTEQYALKTKNVSETINKKELERFVIELSWKSSRIEGNTYDLLETERLIRFGEEAKGHDKEETLMILNHKEAFKAINAQDHFFQHVSISKIEDIHKILVQDIGVKHNIRNTGVGISGSIYLPLDNQYQIKEALVELCTCINNTQNPYTKALLALVGISYIQPFEDGNKRTARLITNAILIAHGLCPLSYRDVDESLYRQSMLVFYELNSIVPMKKIFIEQYIFAATHYFIKDFKIE